MKAHFLTHHRAYAYALAAALALLAAALSAWAGEPVFTNDIPERATMGVVNPLLPALIKLLNGFPPDTMPLSGLVPAEYDGLAVDTNGVETPAVYVAALTNAECVVEPRRSSKWPAFREAMFAKYGTACWWCGATNNPTLDHITEFKDAPWLELVETNVWVCCDGPTIGGHKYRRFGCHWKIGHGGKDWKYHSPGWVIRTVGWGSNAVGRAVQEMRKRKEQR